MISVFNTCYHPQFTICSQIGFKGLYWKVSSSKLSWYWILKGYETNISGFSTLGNQPKSITQVSRLHLHQTVFKSSSRRQPAAPSSFKLSSSLRLKRRASFEIDWDQEVFASIKPKKPSKISIVSRSSNSQLLCNFIGSHRRIPSCRTRRRRIIVASNEIRHRTYRRSRP